MWHGCQIGSPGRDFWDKDITNAPLDPRNAAYMAAMYAAARRLTAGASEKDFNTMMAFDVDSVNGAHDIPGGLYPVNVAGASTPKVPVAGGKDGSGHFHPPSPVPYQSAFSLEYPGSDQHYFVVDAGTAPACREYEYFDAEVQNNGKRLYVYAGQEINTQTTTVIARDGGPTVVGINYLPSAITSEELDATGVPIKHVLNFVSAARTINGQVYGLFCQCHRYPAINNGSPYGGPPSIPQSRQPPQGAQMRLRANFPERGNEACNRVLEALKHYGMVLRDTGGFFDRGGYFPSNIINMLDYPNRQANSPAGRTLSCLNTVHLRDFEFVAAHR